MQTIPWVMYLGDLLTHEDVLTGYFGDDILIQCTLKYFTSWNLEWKSSKTESHSSPLISLDTMQKKATKYDSRTNAAMISEDQLEKWGGFISSGFSACVHGWFLSSIYLIVLGILWLTLHISGSILQHCHTSCKRAPK